MSDWRHALGRSLSQGLDFVTFWATSLLLFGVEVSNAYGIMLIQFTPDNLRVVAMKILSALNLCTNAD